MSKTNDFLTLITSSSNIIRRLVIGVLLTILVGCYCIIAIEFKHDVFILVLGAATMFASLWLVIKINKLLLKVMDNN
ncbi:hypothetical protein [Colwellia sp. BRX8-9]|uniref:hypothetical protein n=1 Tax=Colwellia sp. BRX8-9 TaxID=2759831 RepID=UPI0015F6DD60|nr:hypothetical protein [Colwellia sp. BRX8-9]MBA6347177.1 hypothetical protein [Colwellia sp. BRX8-9]